MLRRITPSEVELGMFVHKLEGSWLKHPFWRSRFLLEDHETLGDLRDSEVDAVIIDTARGKDVVRPVLAATPAPAQRLSPPKPLALRRKAVIPSPEFDPRSTAPAPLAREFGHARALADRGGKVVSRVFFDVRLGKAVDSAAIEPMVSEIFASVQRNPHAFNGLMRCKRDNQFTYQHALAVSALMISLARTMKLPLATIREAGLAGLLLDVGIAQLPLDLESTAGDFRGHTDAELSAHTTLGYQHLQLGGDIPEAVALVALEHHERMDGTGQPRGLGGEAISLLGRMAAICDAYDLLVTDGHCARGVDPATAIALMQDMTGRFDPDILARFIETIGAYPVGSLVLLESGRLAIVFDQDPSDHRQPVVRAFWSATRRAAVKPYDIALGRCFGEDRILGPADPEAYGIADFPKLRSRLYTAAVKNPLASS